MTIFQRTKKTNKFIGIQWIGIHIRKHIQFMPLTNHDFFLSMLALNSFFVVIVSVAAVSFDSACLALFHTSHHITKYAIHMGWLACMSNFLLLFMNQFFFVKDRDKHTPLLSYHAHIFPLNENNNIVKSCFVWNFAGRSCESELCIRCCLWRSYGCFLY